MEPTYQPVLRELAYRHVDALGITLLWNSRANEVSICLKDELTGERLRFEVDATRALDAFNHPFAYAPNQTHVGTRIRPPQLQRREA